MMFDETAKANGLSCSFGKQSSFYNNENDPPGLNDKTSLNNPGIIVIYLQAVEVVLETV